MVRSFQRQSRSFLPLFRPSGCLSTQRPWFEHASRQSRLITSRGSVVGRESRDRSHIYHNDGRWWCRRKDVLIKFCFDKFIDDVRKPQTVGIRAELWGFMLADAVSQSTRISTSLKTERSDLTVILRCAIARRRKPKRRFAVNITIYHSHNSCPCKKIDLIILTTWRSSASCYRNRQGAWRAQIWTGLHKYRFVWFVSQKLRCVFNRWAISDF